MALLEDIGCKRLISERVHSGYGHQQIVAELKGLYPGYPGLSARSVRRFCANNAIHRSSQLCESDVDALVEQAVSQVGPSCTLKGLLQSEGIVVGEQRVRESLIRTTPAYTLRRRNHSYRLLNPTPYYAEYYGHKLHLDQNEKLINFGVTHVAASDGYSGKILDVVTMPIKNNLLIYDTLFRPILLEHGIWDQMRVDCGREFALILHVQHTLSLFRTNTQRAPYVQTTSTMNHRAERHWVEINSRINYPIKTSLIHMQQHGLIDMDCPTTKFCVSMMSGKLAQVGIQSHIAAWNNHRVPGRGVPNLLSLENCHTSHVPLSRVPSLDEAIRSYESSGGHLTPESTFGIDPLVGHQELLIDRQRAMDETLPNPEELFGYVVNGFHAPFYQSIQIMFDKSIQLQAEI